MDDTKLMPDEIWAVKNCYGQTWHHKTSCPSRTKYIRADTRTSDADKAVSPLTDEQIIELAQKHLYVGTGMDKRIITLARAIEARRQSPAFDEKVVRDALEDAQGGLNYIRMRYGDLDGVGFDRCEKGTAAALAELSKGTQPKPAEKWDQADDALYLMGYDAARKGGEG